MQTQLAQQARPPIILSEIEADALSDLALSPANREKQASRMLLEEIDRAQICGAAELPDDVVTMRSYVSFVDETTGATHEVQLVYPAEADTAAHRISILTPVGAGLIGLQTGQTIDWPNRSGELHRLKIVQVRRALAAAA
jgi:regulator of nucleoside diphosphate kinase